MKRKFDKKAFRNLVVVVLIIAGTSRLLFDVECASQDITQRGLRVFAWLKKIPGVYTPKPIPPQAIQELFPAGLTSVDPECVTQGAIFDCRFLATVSALATTERGKQAIANMIQQNQDGSYSVTFPGTPLEPVTVAPLTQEEIYLYAHAITAEGKRSGTWLPILEKAYGTYRNAHQSPDKVVLRTVKHFLFEGRFTPEPELPGYGAAYGASDDNAITMLCGRKPSDVPTISREIGEFGLGQGYVTWRQISSWFDRDGAMSNFINEQDKALTRAMADGEPVIAVTDTGTDDAYGIRSHHAYSVLGYDSVHKLIRIRDVMGAGVEFWDPKTSKPYDGRNDGNFVMTLIDFNKLFSQLHTSAIE